MGPPVSVITSPRSGEQAGAQSLPRGESPAGPTGPPPNGPPPPEKPPRRPGWKRILLGTVLVLLCAGGGSAVFVLNQVHSLRDALKQNGILNVGSGTLAAAAAGDPQTLLLVGDDTRKGFKYYRGYVPDLANEMLLVRIDPNRPYISMMSIPRELQVPITRPNGFTYVGRFNSAYTFGIGTLVKTIKKVLGVSVNHAIVITFPRFKRAVDEMGCVYSTVDRRYYNLNLGTPGTNYQSINLQPGYQKLCGQQALEFVSYRHGDTSLVRDARDQSFLLDVKKQYGPTLADNVGKFEHIFGKAVQTDPGLQSTTGLLNLINTLIFSAGRSVRQVHFKANLQATVDTASQQQIQSSVKNFLYGASSVDKNKTAAVANAVHSHKGATHLPLVPTPGSAQAQAQAAALKLPFPLEYPRVEDRGGSFNPPSLRRYLVHGPDGSAYQTYNVVFYAGQLGQYYDVQGMTWTTAPQFDSPDQTVKVGPRTYYLYYEGSNLKMAAWYEHGAVYWVRNSLNDSIGAGELLAIAEQTKPFTAVHSTSRVPVILKAVGVPSRLSKVKPLSTRILVGSLAGLATLVLLPLLALLTLRRIIDLRRTRPHVRAGQETSERLAASGGLAAVPAGPTADLRRLLGLDGLRHGVLSGVGGGSPHVASGRWSEGTRVYRRSRSRRPLTIFLGVLLLAAAAAAAVYAVTRSHSATPATSRAKVVHRAPAVPNVPVVVLNATSTPGAAHDMAVTLQARHVSVRAVGNVTETLPPGTEILYSTGERAQAKLLAKVLSARSPTVAPVDPVTSAAAAGAKLIVVIA
jgi:polyisoprenyl-teichoic acid--peptidoglycan teichoic acid transferase